MLTLPRGKYICKRGGEEPLDEAEHFTAARSVEAGWTSGIWAACLIMSRADRIRRRTNPSSEGP